MKGNGTAAVSPDFDEAEKARSESVEAWKSNVATAGPVERASKSSYSPDLALAKPLPAGFQWCKRCQASKLAHVHPEADE